MKRLQQVAYSVELRYCDAYTMLCANDDDNMLVNNFPTFIDLLPTVVKVDHGTRRYSRLLKNRGARLLNTGLKKSQTHSYPAHIL